MSNHEFKTDNSSPFGLVWECITCGYRKTAMSIVLGMKEKTCIGSQNMSKSPKTNIEELLKALEAGGYNAAPTCLHIYVTDANGSKVCKHCGDIGLCAHQYVVHNLTQKCRLCGHAQTIASVMVNTANTTKLPTSGPGTAKAAPMMGSKAVLKVNGKTIHTFDNLTYEDPLVKKTVAKEKKCECGSEKCGIPTHSTWCPKNG